MIFAENNVYFVSKSKYTHETSTRISQVSRNETLSIVLDKKKLQTLQERYIMWTKVDIYNKELALIKKYVSDYSFCRKGRIKFPVTLKKKMTGYARKTMN